MCLHYLAHRDRYGTGERRGPQERGHDRSGGGLPRVISGCRRPLALVRMPRPGDELQEGDKWRGGEAERRHEPQTKSSPTPTLASSCQHRRYRRVKDRCACAPNPLAKHNPRRLLDCPNSGSAAPSPSCANTRQPPAQAAGATPWRNKTTPRAVARHARQARPRLVSGQHARPAPSRGSCAQRADGVWGGRDGMWGVWGVPVCHRRGLPRVCGVGVAGCGRGAARGLGRRFPRRGGAGRGGPGRRLTLAAFPVPGSRRRRGSPHPFGASGSCHRMGTALMLQHRAHPGSRLSRAGTGWAAACRC